MGWVPEGNSLRDESPATCRVIYQPGPALYTVAMQRQPAAPSAVWAVQSGPASLPWVCPRALSQQAWQEVARTIQKAGVCFGSLLGPM